MGSEVNAPRWVAEKWQQTGEGESFKFHDSAEPNVDVRQRSLVRALLFSILEAFIGTAFSIGLIL
jgi:hypothetical protein